MGFFDSITDLASSTIGLGVDVVKTVSEPVTDVVEEVAETTTEVIEDLREGLK